MGLNPIANLLWGWRQACVKAGVRLPCGLSWSLAIGFALLVGLPRQGQPQERFLPNDAAVLLQAPSAQVRADRQELRQAMRQWQAQPSNLQIATAAARLAFLAAMAEGDPRWLGNAKAMLTPWWSDRELTADAHFVRALIRQGLHEFDLALLDLEAAIKKDGRRPEFWAWRFAIHMVQADIRRAQDTCKEIGQRFGPQELASCDAVMLYRSGKTAQAIAKLDALAGHSDYQGRYAMEWLTFHRGEARRVAGDRQAAIKIWSSYLSNGGSSHTIRLALIELLNQQKNYSAAWKLNGTPPRSDALLVQAIQTSKALNNGRDAELRDEFLQRISQQESRGDFVNERPIIQYWLDQGSPKKALAMAQQSWKSQKEPADAWLYARAAIESAVADQAAELLRWQAQTGYREPQLDALLDRIKGAASSKAAK